MAPYGYAFDDEAVRVFTALPSKQRRVLLGICEELARHPHRSGDYREAGATGRIYQLKLIGDVLITWWVDDAVREVRIIRIELIE